MFAGAMTHRETLDDRISMDFFVVCFLCRVIFMGGVGGQTVISVLAVNVSVCVTLTHAATHAQKVWARGAAGEEGEAFLGCPLFLNYILDPV